MPPVGPAAEALNLVLGEIAGDEGYRVEPDAMTRPDGERLAIDRTGT